MASGAKNINKIPKYNAVVEEKPVKKSKKKKSIVSILSNKIQKKISKTLIKTFEIAPMTPMAPKLLKDHAEHNDNNSHRDSSSKGSSSKEIPSRETARERRLREIKERKQKEEENDKTNKDPKLLPVPPRYSSNIPVRGSSSNYDVNYYNSNLFDHCSMSQSLPGNNSNSKDEEHKGLNIKRSNSELTPSSSTENLSQLNLDKFVDTKSKYKSDITLVQDSKITLSLADEIFKEASIHRSDSSDSSSSSSGSSSPTSSSSLMSDSSSSSSSNVKENTMNKDNINEDETSNPEKFYFDEKRQKTIRKPIRSEKSRKINELFRRDSEKYMDQQLVDLCSTYYKDYYYGKCSDSSDSKSNVDSDSGTDDDVIEINSARFNKSNKKSKSDDEKSDKSNSERDYSYIVKSNSSSSYFIPNKHSSFNIKDTSCTISKSKTLPVMDSKNISPKIITCPSSDPDKPTTHLVNISGVTIQTNDLSHLFWVPSYLHPEVHPLEFKKIMSTEANSQRRTSIRRTKSFAESARVITPDNISENGEPVINQVQRHKTFDTFQSLEKNLRPTDFNRRKVSLRKSFTIEEENENENENASNEELSAQDKTKEEIKNDHEIINIDNNKENDHVKTTTVNEKVDLRIDTLLPTIPTITIETYDIINTSPTSPTKPINPSTLQNSSSIPDSSSEESLSQSEVENDTEKRDNELSPKIFLPNAADDTENIPLVHGSFKIEEEEEEEEEEEDNSPTKSGWSLFLSSFSKDDKKEAESSKKNKRNSAASPKSPFAFFKSSSSSSLAHKNINYRQGKGIYKAFILEYPLIFKPMTREAEDTIYSISHTKLATTYRPMEQQVYINNIMQRYIRKYKDAAYKIPFKQVRPPKKRRVPRTPPPKKQQRPVSTPPTTTFNFDEPIRARTDSKKKYHGKRVTGSPQKLVDLSGSKLDELLERGIESNNTSVKKPKRRSKIRPLSDSFSEKDVKEAFKSLKNSTSMEHIDNYNSKSSSSRSDNKHKRYSTSAIIPNGYDYSNYSVSSSEDDDDDDDDEIPLAMLKNKRSSIITI